MAWQAHTTSMTLSVGSYLHLIESPQIAGSQTSLLAPGAELTLVLADHSREKAEVVSASAAEAEIRDSKNQLWRITPLQNGEVPSGITAKDMNSQDWVVRQAL